MTALRRRWGGHSGRQRGVRLVGVFSMALPRRLSPIGPRHLEIRGDARPASGFGAGVVDGSNRLLLESTRLAGNALPCPSRRALQASPDGNYGRSGRAGRSFATLF